MIKREHYISQIRKFYDSDLIKIITGIRRAGKSVILEQIVDELKNEGKNVIYLNFEDQKVISELSNAAKLIEYIEKNCREGKNYLFFDEIQEVKDWPAACKTLRLYNNSVFITGSNSKLLSKEFTNEFSGRYVSFRIRPFVYKEILDYTKELGTECPLVDYLVWGGFPKRFELPDKEAERIYLEDLNRSIIENDLIMRYNIQNIELFRQIVNYILKSNARIFSARSIEAYLKNEKIEGSINTIIKYIGYLEEAYIIDKIRPYSRRTKAELIYYFKVYNADVSFNSLRVKDGRYDLTHNLENIVYNELIYMGYSLEVYNNDDCEIDFVATKDGKKYYIQVAYSVAENKAYEREFKALEALDSSAQKILITNDEVDYSTSVVTHISLSKFLLLKDFA